jgi:hypothetical protein
VGQDAASKGHHCRNTNVVGNKPGQMRPLITTIIISLFFSCTQNRTTSDKQVHEISESTLGSDLIAADFLSFTDSLYIDSLTGRVINSFDIYDERNNKIFHVDAEELAEFQFSFFLPRLNLILSKRNFELDVKTADNYETSNEVFLNGEKIQLYTKDELENSDFWDKASRTFFKKLNDLLKKENLNNKIHMPCRGLPCCHLRVIN